MLRFCDECGVAYDDLDHWTYCPHDWFKPGPKAWEDLERLMAFTVMYEAWWQQTPAQGVARTQRRTRITGGTTHTIEFNAADIGVWEQVLGVKLSDDEGPTDG